MGKAMFQHYRVVVEELLKSVLLVMYLKSVRQKWVPVVQGIEFSCNSVLVLESLVEQKLRIELEFEVVATQVLHVIFNNNLDCLSCWRRKRDTVLVLIP